MVELYIDMHVRSIKNLILLNTYLILQYKHSFVPKDLTKNFSVLMKCANKFDCLVYEMFFINELKPTLNVQSDSIRAKVFN